MIVISMVLVQDGGIFIDNALGIDTIYEINPIQLSPKLKIICDRCMDVYYRWRNGDTIVLHETSLGNKFPQNYLQNSIFYVSGWSAMSVWRHVARTLLSGEPDYFGRKKISSGGDLSHYSSASLY